MFQTVKKIIKVFDDNNLFDEGVQLIGSWCFQLYQKHLGAPRFPLMTQDIDFLIPNPYRGRLHPEFIGELEQLGFITDFKRDGSVYLWNAELKIEFITPEKGRGVDKAIAVKPLGLRAIPLRYVNLLLHKPITIEEDGIKILVPDPGHFCIHKLIIAGRRRGKDKFLKDLQQAICTSTIVGEKDLQKVFKTLPGKWKKEVLAVLGKAPKELPLLEAETNRLITTLQNSL